ncbi:unnamed protein product [Brachionus calyciflorus]|uniref:Uncharacterized protein n=1 Tax=Brachionus calyciflorus TaxID=104777 RepID=A0A813X3T1_9BILA|nr:unnamed protein product [Brachionus calyciflorus]
MDFKDYYLKLAGSGLPYFQGSFYQKGYGLGGIFRRIFKYIMPIVRENALPALKKFGKELLKSAAYLVNDSLSGDDLKSKKMKLFKNSNECALSELDLFMTPSTNTSIVSGV